MPRRLATLLSLGQRRRPTSAAPQHVIRERNSPVMPKLLQINKGAEWTVTNPEALRE